MMRALSEAAGTGQDEDISYVSTPEELQEAVVGGVRYIEITEHLNLVSIVPSKTAAISILVKLVTADSIWSIRVRPSCPCLDSNSGSLL
jgi:hypothetical protein